MRGSLRDLLDKLGTPEAMLVASVIFLSPPWVKVLISLTESAFFEEPLMIASVTMVLLPSTVFLRHMLHGPLGHAAPKVPAGKGSHGRLLRPYVFAIVLVMAAWTLVLYLTWMNVEGAFSVTNVLWRFFYIPIPVHAAAVLVLTCLYGRTTPDRRLVAIRVAGAALFFVFAVLAIREIGSSLAT